MSKDLAAELLEEFSLLKLHNLTFQLKQTLDDIHLEELDQLIDGFTQLGGHPDEVLFLKSLVALKMTKKNLEVNHFFNRQLKPSSGPAVEKKP